MSFGAYKENLNEDIPTLSAMKMYTAQLTIVSRKLCVDILEGGVKRQWGNRKSRFSVLLDAESSEP